MPRTSVRAVSATAAQPPDLPAAAAAGEVAFYIERSNGSQRRMAYLPPGSAARETAEHIAAQRSATPPVSMRDIAKSMHVSIPTVRRIINSLELSLHVEAGQMTCETGSCTAPEQAVE